MAKKATARKAASNPRTRTSKAPGDATGRAMEEAAAAQADAQAEAQRQLTTATQLAAEEAEEISDDFLPDEVDDEEEIVVATAIEDIDCIVGDKRYTLKRGLRYSIPISDADFLAGYTWY